MNRPQVNPTMRPALRILAIAALSLAATLMMVAQTASPQAALLSRARAQEQAGRADLAAQTWQQVLLTDPNNREALAGAARAARLAGKDAEMKSLLDRLRHLDPHNADIARIEAMSTSKAQTAQLQQAAQLAQTGHPDQALRLYRSIWNGHPPDGDWALAYYDTQASLEAERPAAVAALRALARKYPADDRYPITLGRILTYTPKSRTEGMQMLERFPAEPAAQAALRQAHLWDAQNPATAAGTRQYLSQHPDAQIERAFAEAGSQHASTPHAAAGIAQGAAESEAFAALSAGHTEDAEQRFLSLQAEQPSNPRVAAGLGFLRMKQNNFPAATALLEQAEQGGLHRSEVEDALKTSRFWAAMQHGTQALNADSLDEAVGAFQAALHLQPSAPDALNGLAGTYLKAAEAARAIPLYRQLLRLQPQSTDAARGLFTAELQSNDPAAAIQAAHAFPPKVRAALEQNPEYLRSLASAFKSTGQLQEAQSTLQKALALPAPPAAAPFATRLAYAALLVDAGRLAQAAGLYRDLLYEDPGSIPAWQAMIALQHQTNHDAEALATLQRMSPATYNRALDDTGFLSLVAAVYQQQNRLDLAEDLLERAAHAFNSRGRAVPLDLQLQIAATYLQQNRPEQAFPVYKQILTAHPDNPDAWKGLISALHQTHRDRDALAQLQLLPAALERNLARDMDYQQTLAGIYAATGHVPAALQLIAQIQAHFRSAHNTVPASIDIQNAWLLYNTHDDTDLYASLMALGGRDDLDDDQRRTVQSIWAAWSVRRAGEAVDAGNTRRSLEILNVAYQAFPDNPDVSKALAAGYLKAGDPRHALAIFDALHLANPSASDYQVMIGAALAVPNLRQAESWLREALEKFARDRQVLALAARFEQARGDHTRAAAYWKASLAAMPAVDPAKRLAHVLDRADAGPAGPQQPGSLANLLDPESDASPRASRPVLPSYTNNYAEERSFRTPGRAKPGADTLYGPDPYTVGIAPVPLADAASPLQTNPARPNTPQATATTFASGFNGEQQAAGNEQNAQAFAPPDFLNHPEPSTPALANSAAGPLPSSALTGAVTTAEDAADSAVGTPQVRPSTSVPVGPAHPLQLTSSSSPFSLAAIDPQPNASLHYPGDAARNLRTDATSTASDAHYIQPQAASAPQLATRPSTPAPRAYIEPEPVRQTGVTDAQLQQTLPPLRGPWGAAASTGPPEHDTRSDTENQIAVIDADYSPWRGGTGYISHRSGVPGFDQLEVLEAPFEASTTLGGAARLTAIVVPSLLDSGAADGTSTNQFGTLAAGAKPAQQNSTGVGGEVQLTTANFGLSAGTTPRGFLVPNIIGRIYLHPAAGPLTFNFNREALRDSQLSYAGVRDPGSVSSTFAGNVWGGVIANSGNLQYSRGDDASGYYAGLGGQYITGLNVLTNNRIDGVAGAYWKLLEIPETADLTVGANFFAMHYAHNLRYFTYGQGGYFSPGAYFLANVPFTLNGQYNSNLHYTLAGALGLQAFQEDSSLFYPTHVYTAPVPAPTPTPVSPTGSHALHPVLPIFPILPNPTPFSNPSYPSQSVVGGNYDLHAEISDRVLDRWYIGGFLSLNNTRDYANQTVGFFIRYMSRPQDLTQDEPTGLFPYQGLRPLLVP